MRILVCLVSVAMTLGCMGEIGGDDDSGDIGAIAACPSRHLEITYDGPHQLSGGRLKRHEAYRWSVQKTGSAGRRVVRSELNYGDPEVSGGPRAETEVSGNGAFRFADGDRFYYGFRVFIPKGWVPDGINEDIVFQWHNIADRDLGEANKSPNMFLALKRDQFVLRITSDDNRVSTPSSVTKEQRTLVANLNFSRGKWHQFVFAAKWSHGTGGRIRAWHKAPNQSDYSKVLDHAGPNMHNDLEPGYLKWGIYKPAWRSGPTAVSRRVVKHDNIRVGTSFAQVDPTQVLCAP